ncbi:apolipoprotein L1 isoform X2 [Cheilinus undulatus]|uniref:apolipoprotein L1 isoform X2 n=1 Tax=Cheilinus undulatus TaxID=241271 RepID=UPI001BD6DC96|nr:apolipoprotein L1 isoform X2 [Cheilinus undulatus]
MDRYDNLDLDLEVDGGGVAQKAALFGGMFKRSSKIIEPSAPAQDTLSVNSELSRSSESLTDNSKEKGSVFKDMFKKTTKANKEGQQQDSLSVHSVDVSVSSDSSAENKPSKEKSNVFSGILKRPHKPGHARRPSQDLLDIELTDSNENLSDKTTTKETGGMFGGMFKKAHFGARTQSQEDLSAPSERSGSTDNLSVNGNTKESGGVFSGMFKKSPKPSGGKTQSQEDLTAASEVSGSTDNLSSNKNSKESGGVFGGMFKKSPKPFARAQSQEDLTAPSERSGSTDNLSVNGNTKESGGVFSGMFKKSPKPFARAQSQEELSAPGELSGSNDNLTENNNTKEKGGIFGGVFKKKVAKSQSQEDLTGDIELSARGDNLTEKSSKGEVSAKKKNPFTSSQDKEKSEKSGDSSENNTTEEKPKAKQNGFSAMMKSTFYADKKDKNSDSDSEQTPDSGEGQQKPNKFAEAMTKLNPFRSANKHEKQEDSDDEDSPDNTEKSSHNKQSAAAGGMSKLFRSANKKDAEDTEEMLKESENQREEKPRTVKGNMIQRERKERSETPLVPPRQTEEEMKRTSTYDKVKSRGTEDNQENKDMTSRERKTKPSETPAVHAKPSEESQSDDELLNEDGKKTKVKKHKHHNPFMPRAAAKAQSDDEGLKEKEDPSSKVEKKDEEDKEKTEETKVKKPKRHNPFMPRVKASSDDEGLKDEEDNASSKEEKKDEEGKEKSDQPKVRKPKKHNPFLPQVKGKVVRRAAQDGEGNSAENEGANRPLFDQLEDFRIGPAQPRDGQDVEDLMEWWNTVESWEETPQDEDLTEKEEAKAFAVTADKVQKGIRVFNKLFSERAESLWQHVIDLNSIADGLDKFSKNTKIAQITGGSTSAIGGVATIAGLALAPVTMGTSLIVTAVGLGVATAGGLTSAGAGITNQVNNSQDRKKVEKIVQDYQEKMADLNKCLKFIKQGIENLKKFDLLKMKNQAYNRDFPVLSAQFYEDGAMVGKAILINANEIMRVVQIANVAGSTAARAVQIASMATGVLTGLFVGMDIYFVAKDSKELKKGAKSEFAAKIREVATQLHDGLVELNTIREELQATSPENSSENKTDAAETEKKEKENQYSSSEEDEIDRIKKAIKKDYEHREYV